MRGFRSKKDNEWPLVVLKIRLALVQDAGFLRALTATHGVQIVTLFIACSDDFVSG